MDKAEARVDAQNMLNQLLKTQPNLLVDKGSYNQHAAKELANFCADFVDTLSDRILKSAG